MRANERELAAVRAGSEKLTGKDKVKNMVAKLTGRTVGKPEDFRTEYGVELEALVGKLAGLTDEQYDVVAKALFYAYQCGAAGMLPPGSARKVSEPK